MQPISNRRWLLRQTATKNPCRHVSQQLSLKPASTSHVSTRSTSSLPINTERIHPHRLFTLLLTPAMSPATAATGGGMAVIWRLERLELMLSCLEEIKSGGGGGGGSFRLSSVAASVASSSGEGLTTATDGGNSSESSPSETRKGCRDMEEVIAETQVKGSLMDRISFLESRFLKLEEIIESEKREIEEINSSNKSSEKKKHRSLRKIVKSCVKGNLNTRD